MTKGCTKIIVPELCARKQKAGSSTHYARASQDTLY